MKTIKYDLMIASLAMILASACSSNTKVKEPVQNASQKPKLEEVFADSTYQLTGVAVSSNGRLFTNYPYWLDQHSYSVVEVKDGKPVPYPNAAWNSFEKGENGNNKFVCVQSVVTDDAGYLWVFDNYCFHLFMV